MADGRGWMLLLLASFNRSEHCMIAVLAFDWQSPLPMRPRMAGRLLVASKYQKASSLIRANRQREIGFWYTMSQWVNRLI